MQCLYNVSKKKLWVEFIMEFIKMKTSTSWIIDFWWKPEMSKIPQKGRFLSFYNILRKSSIIIFVFYCDAKYSDTLRYFMGFHSSLLLLVFANISTALILSGQSQFLIFCPSAWDSINLSRFLHFSTTTKIHIYIIFHQQCKTVQL